MTKIAYVGHCRTCGALVAARMDDSEESPKHRKAVAKDVAEMVNEDLVIERIDSAQVRLLLEECHCVPNQPGLL